MNMKKRSVKVTGLIEGMPNTVFYQGVSFFRFIGRIQQWELAPEFTICSWQVDEEIAIPQA